MVSFDEEMIIVYLDDPDCNNSADNGDEWILNENVNFDHSLCCDDINSDIDMSPYTCLCLCQWRAAYRRECVIPRSRNTYLIAYSVFRSYFFDLLLVFDRFQFQILFSIY